MAYGAACGAVIRTYGLCSCVRLKDGSAIAQITNPLFTANRYASAP
jgi:hypothetical protein